MIFIMKSTKECPMEKNMWNWKSNDKKGIHVTVISNPTKTAAHNERWVQYIRELSI